MARGLVQFGLLKLGGWLTDWLDGLADLRIFNHPHLLAWYRSRARAGINDIWVYNGADFASASELDRYEARQHLFLPQEQRILVFVGAASVWHGVEYLVALQKEFNAHLDDITIVLGGGKVDRDLDPEGVLHNIAPLDERECAVLIRAADACVLPVKEVRISPGSPLKLYDYIVNERYIFAQDGTAGYSDEVLGHGVGAAVDFTEPDCARRAILEWFAGERSVPVGGRDLEPAVSWDARMAEWIAAIDRVRLAQASVK